jgi:hypothetical protein
MTTGITGILAASSGYTIAGLLTLLLASVYLNKSQDREIKNITKKSSEVYLVNVQLNKTIVDLRQELIDSPKEYIQITKDVQNEICTAKYSAESILSLPPINTATQSKEVITNEKKSTVDIDAPLPDELVRLLK